MRLLNLVKANFSTKNSSVYLIYLFTYQHFIQNLGKIITLYTKELKISFTIESFYNFISKVVVSKNNEVDKDSGSKIIKKSAKS